MAAKAWYQAVLAGLRKLRDTRHDGSDIVTLENLMSFDMGSMPNGGTISHLMCANTKSCLEQGSIVCSKVSYKVMKCRLVQYCSEKCKAQHWSKHRSRCAHPYLEETWQPSWVIEGRDPTFLYRQEPSTYLPTFNFWGDVPAMDYLQLSSNEALDYSEYWPDIKLCFAALPREGAEYVKRCVEFIYDCPAESEGDLSFQRCLDTRGEGKVYSVQTSIGIKRPLEMFHSSYGLSAAFGSMKDTTLHPTRLDSREKYFAGLKPSHRMAFERFRESGILAPFSLNTVNFTDPNRLLFCPQGNWLLPPDANPLHGWDVASVQMSGFKHGASPEDIFGCLFFHVKDELREFAKRIKEFSIDIHVTQFDASILAKGITIGALPAFEDASFDRICTSNLMDSVGLRTCLSDWAPLLNRNNKHASILAHSKLWHVNQPQATAQWNPHAIKVLMERCNKIPGLEVKMKTIFAQGVRSPALFRLFESLNAFHDDEGAFQDYLIEQDTDSSAEAFDLQLRTTHRIHPKRLGIPLNAPRWQKLPDLSSNEFMTFLRLEVPICRGCTRILCTDISIGVDTYQSTPEEETSVAWFNCLNGEPAMYGDRRSHVASAVSVNQDGSRYAMINAGRSRITVKPAGELAPMVQ
ncbi:hypothetical protein B0H10DRAFT_1945278 [Mycena sp. CBHHK59/15]|nr:hypothetical protein B0H10DRAFT_1945278 [Mycena sp. CBHHK59/15]